MELQDKDPALSYQGLNQRLGLGGYSSVYLILYIHSFIDIKQLKKLLVNK